MSAEPEIGSASLSRVRDNHLAHTAVNLASALSDIKPFWEYKTNNPKFQKIASLGNKRALSWWLTRQIDMRFLDVVKWGLAGATGYAHLCFNPDTDDQDMLPEDPRNVFPVRPAGFESIQDAFGVIIRRERTLNWVKQMYPKSSAGVKPDRDGFLNAIEKHNRMSLMAEKFGIEDSAFWSQVDSAKKRSGEMNIPIVDVYTLYVKDRTRNNHDYRVEVGSKDFAWKYLVEKGDMLYPRLRRIVFCKTGILDDNPSPYWHGLFPLVKLTLDPWPWSYLGKAPLWDLLPLQDELDRMLRVVSDWLQKVAQPDVVANAQAVSRSEFKQINTRVAGLKLRTNPMGGQAGVTVQPPPNLPPQFLEILSHVYSRMDTLSGVQDMTKISQLNQIPASETIERMMEAMTPLVRLRSRVMEAALRPFAMISLSNFLQFDTLPQRLATLGPEGMTFEDAELYDPGTMIPDRMQDERGRDLETREEKAIAMLRMFTYHVAPGSLLSASEITEKLLTLQLFRAGAVDIVTLLEKLQIPNIGAERVGVPDTILERLAWQANIGMGAGAEQAGPGRKPTAQEMPKMVSKDSGTRTTIAES